jgi:hypothetical protein
MFSTTGGSQYLPAASAPDNFYNHHNHHNHHHHHQLHDYPEFGDQNQTDFGHKLYTAVIQQQQQQQQQQPLEYPTNKVGIFETIINFIINRI